MTKIDPPSDHNFTAAVLLGGGVRHKLNGGHLSEAQADQMPKCDRFTLVPGKPAHRRDQHQTLVHRVLLLTLMAVGGIA